MRKFLSKWINLILNLNCLLRSFYWGWHNFYSAAALAASRGHALHSRVRTARDNNLILSKSAFQFSDEVTNLRNDRIVDKHGERIKQMLILHLLSFTHDLTECRLLLEVLSNHRHDIVQFSVTSLLSSLVLLLKLTKILLDTLRHLSNFACLLVKLVLLSANFHHLLATGLKLTLNLLQVSTFFEQVLGRVSTLILKNLLPFKISTVGTLLELATVVIIPDLQVSQRVVQSLDFFLALADFAVELITVPLQLLFFLSGFDNVVSLGVLAS